MALWSNGRWVDADEAELRIRSLRVKLFRERAKFHLLGYRAESGDAQHRHVRAYLRFGTIADAIERGER